MVIIRKLSADRREDCRDLRLEALKSDPSAFGSSFEEEVTLTEGEWKKRIRNTLFAVSDDKLIGMIVCLFNEWPKTKHIAETVGVYVTASYRGQGVSTRMLERALLLGCF